MDWIRKLLGYHICESFTAWGPAQEGVFYRMGDRADPTHPDTSRVTVIRRWQECSCTACGKIIQRYLEI